MQNNLCNPVHVVQKLFGEKMKTFKTWLFDYRRNGPIKDLADDARISSPNGEWGPTELKKWMVDNRACPEAFKALEAAKRAYRRYDLKMWADRINTISTASKFVA
jgi:hypothetical protein